MRSAPSILLSRVRCSAVVLAICATSRSSTSILAAWSSADCSEFASDSLTGVVFKGVQPKGKNYRENPEQGRNDEKQKFKSQAHDIRVFMMFAGSAYLKSRW